MKVAPEQYIAMAIASEAAIVANAQPSTRNQFLNRSAFKLGTIPGAPLDVVVDRLSRATRENGYLAEHGESATRKVIESGFQNGHRKQRRVPRHNRAERRLLAFQSKRAPSTGSSPTAPSPLRDAHPGHSTFPVRTAPDGDGKPRFLMVGKEGPPRRCDEKRRHVYLRESAPVRIKIMLKNGGAVNWYRVEDTGGTLG